MSYRVPGEVEEDIEISKKDIMEEVSLKVIALIRSIVYALILLAFLGIALGFIFLCFWAVGFIIKFIAQYSVITAILIPIILILSFIIFCFIYAWRKQNCKYKLSFKDFIFEKFSAY